MTRYYIDAEDGPVSRPEGRVGQARVWAYPDDHKGPLQPEYTEVRIVPADAIVIERSELPEVTEAQGDYVVRVFIDGCWYGPEGASKDANPNVIRARALARLALAEHIAANPPVDEAAVQELAEAIRAAESPEGIFSTDLARALIRAGYAKGGE